MESGTGMTITFGTSGTALKLRTMAIKAERAELDFSHAGSGAVRPLKAGALVSYRASITGVWDAETPMPITAALETITLTYPSTGAGNTSTYVGSGQMLSFEGTGEYEKEQTFSAELLFNAAPTHTP
jgi:hypothetical protein